MISRMTRVQTLPRFSSWRPLRCWIFAHLLCPATGKLLLRCLRLIYCVDPLILLFDAMAEPLLIAKNAQTECHLLPGLANRHGLITGATGTGKTVTLQTMAENFSQDRRAGVHGRRQGRPDRHQPAGHHRREAGRGARRNAASPAPEPRACPVTLWDVFGEQGHPVRATVSDMGPLLLGAHAQRSTKPRPACCSWCSRSPTTTACCCWT